MRIWRAGGSAEGGFDGCVMSKEVGCSGVIAFGDTG